MPAGNAGFFSCLKILHIKITKINCKERRMSDKKIFSYYQYDSFCDEKIIGIVMSSNLKEAEKTVKDHYRNAYRGDFTVNGWKIKEIELSDDGCTEIYYGG